MSVLLPKHKPRQTKVSSTLTLSFPLLSPMHSLHPSIITRSLYSRLPDATAQLIPLVCKLDLQPRRLTRVLVRRGGGDSTDLESVIGVIEGGLTDEGKTKEGWMGGVDGRRKSG